MPSDKYTINNSTLSNIGDAIREQTGSQSGITPENMPAAIRSISGGGIQSIDIQPLFSPQDMDLDDPQIQITIDNEEPINVYAPHRITDMKDVYNGGASFTDGDILCMQDGYFAGLPTNMIGFAIMGTEHPIDDSVTPNHPEAINHYYQYEEGYDEQTGDTTYIIRGQFVWLPNMGSGSEGLWVEISTGGSSYPDAEEVGF